MQDRKQKAEDQDITMPIPQPIRIASTKTNEYGFSDFNLTEEKRLEKKEKDGSDDEEEE